MANRNDAWGIEVGRQAVKAMRLVREGSGKSAQVRLAEYEIIPFKTVLTAPDVDADEMVQLALDELMSKHDLTKSTIVVSVPGDAALAKFANLPPVEPKKVAQIVQYEAQQQIPFPIEEVEWDYQVFQEQDSPDVEVGIFAITKERVMNWLSNFTRVGLNVDQLTLSPLAVYNAFIYDREVGTPGSSEKKEGDGGEAGESKGGNEGGTMYLDVGTQATDVVIVENNGIWLRTFRLGGHHFTESLVKAFKVSYGRAEKEKLRASTSKHARQLFTAMRPTFSDLVQELQRSLGFYQSRNSGSDVKRIVAVGSTMRLPGLSKFLKQQLGLEVERPQGFRRIKMEGAESSTFAKDAINLAPAYGLALQGLGLHRVRANLLPAAIQNRRMWSSKQPWIAAAAACVLAAAGVAVLGYVLERTSVYSQQAATDAAVVPIIAAAQVPAREATELKSGSDPRQQIDNLLATLDYRGIYPMFMQDLAAGLERVRPQDAVLAGGRDAELPPRPMRREIRIDTITTRFIPLPETTTPGPAGAMGPGGAAGAGGAMGPGGPSAVRPQNVVGQQFPIETFWPMGQESGPHIEVTLTGTTPNAQGLAFLENTLLDGLRQAAKRGGRPYRLQVPEQGTVVSLNRVGSSGTPGVGSGQGEDETDRPVRGRGFGARGAQGGRGFGGEERAYQPTPAQGREEAVSAAQALDMPISDLLPPAPPEEDTSQDWAFVIRFHIELLKPEEARRAVARESRSDASGTSAARLARFTLRETLP